MPFISNNNTAAVVRTFSATTASRGDSKESTGCSPPVTISPPAPSSQGVIMVVMKRAITLSVLFAMQLVIMDTAVFTFHALSSTPALLGLGLLSLLGCSGLVVRCIISELQTNSDSRCRLHQAILLMFLGCVLGNTQFASALSHWLYLAIPPSSLHQTNAMALMIMYVPTLGLMCCITFVLDAYHVLLALAAAPTILPIWYLGGVTPAAMQQGLMIPSGAWTTLYALGVAIGAFRILSYDEIQTEVKVQVV